MLRLCLEMFCFAYARFDLLQFNSDEASASWAPTPSLADRIGMIAKSQGYNLQAVAATPVKQADPRSPKSTRKIISGKSQGKKLKFMQAKKDSAKKVSVQDALMAAMLSNPVPAAPGAQGRQAKKALKEMKESVSAEGSKKNLR